MDLSSIPSFKFSQFFLYIPIAAFLLVSCGFAEEMTDRAADSPEGMEKAYVIELDDTEAAVASKTWENFMDQYNSKVTRIKGSQVRMAQNVLISGLPGNVDIKSLFDQTGNNTEMRLWFVKDAEYLTPQTDPQSYDVIDGFIDEYFTRLEAAQIQLEVESEEDKLKNLERDLNRLRKDNEKLHSDITKAEQTIKESRIKIEENLQEQDQLSNKIQEQKEVIRRTQGKLSRVN